MERPKATPKDFFLWAGAMIALYAGVIAFITLLFQYINYAFQDSLNYYVDPYQSGIAYSMASLIVLAPVFLILMRVIRRGIQHDASRGEVWVRRWALYLVVFVAGAAMVVDLIVLLTTFLSGEELTVRFLLKVLVVLLVAAAGFMHFLADIWGYWDKNPHYARYINWSTALLIVLSIAAGFLIVGSPQQARLYRMDTQRLNDLQNIQSQVVYYWQQKNSLPETLDDLDDPLSYFTLPMDPQTNLPYEYVRQSPLDFTLCATFSREGNGNSGSRAVYEPVPSPDKWEHGVGRTCFDRSIDPELYPPFTKNI